MAPPEPYVPLFEPTSVFWERISDGKCHLWRASHPLEVRMGQFMMDEMERAVRLHREQRLPVVDEEGDIIGIELQTIYTGSPN